MSRSLRRLTPSAAAALLLLAACEAQHTPLPDEESGIRFSDLSSRSPELAIVQLGGGDEVDYIIDSIGPGAAWLDHDGDGDPDLYLAMGATQDQPNSGPPDRLLRNQGDPDGDGVPTWVDVTSEAGLGDRLWSFGVAVADYDGDGDPDLYLTNWGPNRLYRNNGDGSFSDVAAAAGVADPGFSVSAVWGDVDHDGDLDLYVVNYLEFDFSRYPARGERLAGGAPPCTWRGIETFCGPRNLEAASDRFYRNDGDSDGDGVPHFTEQSEAAGFDPGARYFGLSAHFFDADGDGDDDLYVANDSVRNTFFVNDGGGRFAEDAIFSGLAYNEQGNEQAGMGIATADYDGDGWTDLAVTNFSHDHDTLYRSENGEVFLDVSYPAGLGSPSFLTLGWDVRFLDLDQDGWEDLVVAHGHVYPQVDGRQLGTSFRQLNGFYRNNGQGSFEELSMEPASGMAQVKSSRSVLPVDLEGDGDLDLLVTNLNDTPDLLRNDGASGNWLQVSLRGRRSNRDGIGARVSIVADGRTQYREIRRNTSYGSTLPLAHFGLGRACSIETLEVRWPSGERTQRSDVDCNERVVIEE